MLRHVRSFAAAPLRTYFYVINTQGHLYNTAENILQAPHGPTFYRDVKFLNFFTARLQRNTTQQHQNYQWVSPCGVEMNYLHAEVTPIVYHTLLQPDAKSPADVSNSSSGDSVKEPQLLYAGNLRVPFVPTELRVDADGKLFYPHNLCGLALVRSSLAIELGDGVHMTEKGFVLKWQGNNILLRSTCEG